MDNSNSNEQIVYEYTLAITRGQAALVEAIYNANPDLRLRFKKVRNAFNAEK